MDTIQYKVEINFNPKLPSILIYSLEILYLTNNSMKIIFHLIYFLFFILQILLQCLLRKYLHQFLMVQLKSLHLFPHHQLFFFQTKFPKLA